MVADIKIILQGLSHKSPLVCRMEEQLIDFFENDKLLIMFAEELRKEIKFSKKMSANNEPFYHFLLATARLMLKDRSEAKASLAHAMQAFKIRRYSLNEVLGEWLFAIIHFEDKEYIQAERACEIALVKITRLIQDSKEQGHYQQADEYRGYFIRLGKFLDSIRGTPPVGLRRD